MLTCLVVHVMRARRAPADMEGEGEGQHVEDPFERGEDYISYSGASRLNPNGKRSSWIVLKSDAKFRLDVVLVQRNLGRFGKSGADLTDNRFTGGEWRCCTTGFRQHGQLLADMAR